MKKIVGLFGFFCVLQIPANAGDTALWDTLTANCGKAFEGKVTKDTENSGTWGSARLVMHVRDCSDSQVKVPLHMDDNRSRVWIISKLDGGKMRLKHDHWHAAGVPDAVTMYGGTSTTPSINWIEFPVDAESITMFKKEGLEASVSNSWHLGVKGSNFYYRLTRPSGREFEIEFDLSKSVDVPPMAWDIAPKEAH